MNESTIIARINEYGQKREINLLQDFVKSISLSEVNIHSNEYLE